MPILLFDGHCNLCNAWVKFIVKRDSAGTIRFASLQSRAGRRLLEEHKIDENYIESPVFFEEERFSVSSNAALRTLSYLDSWQKHLIFLSVVHDLFVIWSIVSLLKTVTSGLEEESNAWYQLQN